MSDPTIADEEGPEIIGTKETVELYDWVGKRAAEIASIDTVVITREDFASEPDMDSAVKKLSSIFEKAGLSMSQDDMTTTISDALNNTPSATSLDMNADGRGDIGLIIAPSLAMTKEDAVSLLTNIPADRLKDIPAEDKDYIAAIMFHEAEHVAQPAKYEGEGSIARETDSDLRALEEMKHAAEKGLALPEVKEGFVDARMIANLHVSLSSMAKNAVSMNFADGFFDSHSTNLLLQNKDGILPEDSQSDARTILITNTYVNQMAQVYIMQEAALDLQAANGQGNPGSTRTPFFEDSADALKIFMDPGYSSQIVEDFIRSNPEIAHAALGALREKGYIKDDTPEAKYADRVIGFFEKHVDLESGIENIRTAKELFSHVPDKDNLPKSDPEPPTSIEIQTPASKQGFNYGR